MVSEDGKRRVLFTFAKESYDALKKVQAECNYAMPADVIKDALSVYFMIRDNAKEGFHEITLTNTKTGEKRICEDKNLELRLTTYFPKK